MSEQSLRAKFPNQLGFHAEPPPADLGQVVLEKEIPSEVALVTPLIIRTSEFLSEQGVLPIDFKNKFQLCLDEALRNAVIHGNHRDFSKKVKLRAFVSETSWGVAVEDEGNGFSLEKIKDPREEKSLLLEGGRGLHLIAYYMDRIAFYCGGRILVMTKSL
jgi:anti-sigma regulatory factor (Ser/Thr protein kinase)